MKKILALLIIGTATYALSVIITPPNFTAEPMGMIDVSSITFTNGWSIACTTNGLEFVAP